MSDMKGKISYYIGIILVIVGFYGILILIGKWIFTFGLFKLLIYIFSLFLLFGFSMITVSLDDIKINVKSIIESEIIKLEQEFDFFSGRENEDDKDEEICNEISLKIEVLKDLLKKIGE